jgi:hypothetical protein
MTDAPTPRRGRLFGRAPRAFDPNAIPDPIATGSPQAAEWAHEALGVNHESSEAGKLSPVNSILASATRITSKTVASASFRKSTHEEWQDDAWAMYDLVGELRFSAMTLAQRTSKARLYVGKLGDGPNEGPALVTDPKIAGILEAVGDGHLGMSQLIQRMTINLFLPGDGWLVGIPKELLRARAEASAGDKDTPVTRITQVNRNPGQPDGLGNDLPSLDDLDWRMLSISEVSFIQGEQVKLKLGPADQESITCSPDDVYMVRVWHSHPRYWWQADSPTRSALPVLRELVGLTMHISAQVDSRLAGAGMLVVPASAARAAKVAAGIPEDSQQDPFTDGLIASMITPISDRSNASALVPLVVTVPDESTGKFEHIAFDKPLDSEAKSMRDEGIRRLALSLDMPPELLLGTSDTNHWGAWLVQEDVVSAHIEPPLALICDALTTQYLRPVLEENGYSTEDAEQYVVWYDVSELIIRPNRSADAQALYGLNELSGKSLRAAAGFDETDAPEGTSEDPAIMAVFEMVKADPGLMAKPGLDVLLEQVRALLDGKPMTGFKVAEPAPIDLGEVDALGNPVEKKPEQPALPPVGTPVGAAATNPGAAPAAGPGAPMPTGADVTAAATDATAFRVDPALDGVYVGTHKFPELRGTLSAELEAAETDDIVDLTGL